MKPFPSHNDNADQELKKLLGTETGFVSPDGYFEELPTSIKLQLGAFPESDFTSLPKHEYPFTNPASYFDELKNIINKQIVQEENFEVVPLIPANETGFDLPEGYFEQAKFNILDETTKHQSTIETGSENAFKIDDNYFEKSKKNILAQTVGTTKNKNTTIYRPLVRRPILKTFLRYAAVVAVAFGLGYMTNHKQNIVVYNNNGQLSKPVIIEDITYEELQAALFDEDLDTEDLIELANMEQQTANNNDIQKPSSKSKNNIQKSKEDYTPKADKAPNQQQIEQYIIDNEINPEEL